MLVSHQVQLPVVVFILVVGKQIFIIGIIGIIGNGVVLLHPIISTNLLNHQPTSQQQQILYY